jgi:hypothetical protein
VGEYLIARQEHGQMRIEGQDGAKQTLGSENILLLWGREGDKLRRQTRRVKFVLGRFCGFIYGLV